ncbi:hypothetical protein BCR33DRAFT_712965 [Rhizoclosmatium globosum]|uniref:GATA-type domain-containing protein n=1 Tax=Rhizoclosmatium globosum TaxID=329046 RepID=A0A1Y2CXH2_9FUNG|nr:hypothetical protein BCR33DRAFT_712965 [Rhizoclosmatium globosum]|eukprot:ORY51035.1 hypothetical protein BCR33DRAFT_712965 [Rhizoclosmatium globosum]
MNAHVTVANQFSRKSPLEGSDQFLSTLIGTADSFSDYFAMEAKEAASSPASEASTGSGSESLFNADEAPKDDPFGSFVIPNDSPSNPVFTFPVAPVHSVQGDFELGPRMVMSSAKAVRIISGPSVPEPSSLAPNEAQGISTVKMPARRRSRPDSAKSSKSISKLLASMEEVGEGKLLPKAAQKKLRAMMRNLICTSCGTNSTPLWRKDNAGNHLCNACGLYFIKYQTTKPPAVASNNTPKPSKGWTIQSHLASFPSKSSQQSSGLTNQVPVDSFMSIPAAEPLPVVNATNVQAATETQIKHEFMTSLLYSAEQGFVASTNNPVPMSSSSSSSSASWAISGGDQGILEDYCWTEMMKDDEE